MQTQSFKINADVPGKYTDLFMYFVLVIMLIYALIILVNFFRDKYINKESSFKNADYIDLFTILNKLLFISGFGFVIGNVLQVFFEEISNRKYSSMMNFGGDWNYLTFGVIIIFIGISFKSAKKIILKDREDRILKNEI
jgi:hypothetical protein